ncbi:MAG TPA: BrnA antitoxin family protein [Alicycliphilus sp.]|nr:BrnA antitoxin family protein [Alicycliphilus sp.]
MNGNKHATPTAWVDPDDAPELDDAFLERADVYLGEKLVRRGRPKAAATKEAVKLRLDADLLAALRATGDGWQTRINDMLRASMHLAGRV